MSQENKETETGLMSSKYWKLLLVILAGLFIFGAPYVVYLASKVLKRGVFFSFAGGLLSLIIGFLLVWYLIKNKVIT
jgi:phosphoglycerol transferase MdoB-like AlkP superfamily enzyme